MYLRVAFEIPVAVKRSIFFSLEDGGSMFLRNVISQIKVYTVSQLSSPKHVLLIRIF
jgi:hypothetical protein